MASESTVVLDKNPNRLDKQQTSKAVRALLKHIRTEQKKQENESTKRSLLGENASGDESGEDAETGDHVPVWLILTTKKHIIDRARLKPSKVAIPHPLHTSPDSSICLITVDPQRAFKNVVAHPSFPASLRSRVNRVIGVSKLRAKYKTYESRRQLLSEHEVFLADDRVVRMLPQLLGKIFFQTTTKRPIPICISGGKKAQQAAPEGEKSVATPEALAAEITRTLSTALVHLSPSTCTSVRVASSNWKEDDVVDNIEAVVQGLVEKFVPKKWKGVKSLHIKGANTAALPLWLADELWVDERDIVDRKGAPEVTREAIKDVKEPTNKRKADEDGAQNKSKKAKKTLAKVDQHAEQEGVRRKEKLRKQKAEAVAEIEGDGKLAKAMSKDSRAVAVT